jgi:hypothetical protein
MEGAAHNRVDFTGDTFGASFGGVKSICWRLEKELQSSSLHIDSHRST